MELTYTSYLKVEELLTLQEPKSTGPEHDETLFIIIHQAYELWFKQLLHELDYLTIRLTNNELFFVNSTLKRILTIMKVLVHQVDILETMTPLDFESFRGHLGSSSGFQSFQFREIEFLLGHKRRSALEHYSVETEARKRLEKRYAEITLWDAFLRCLKKSSYAVPESILQRDVTQPTESSKELQEILIDIYRTKHVISTTCELLVDLDEGVQEWRYRHVKMVERTIGIKMGTGSSSGAAYLKTTLFKPLFPDLWTIRASF